MGHSQISITLRFLILLQVLDILCYDFNYFLDEWLLLMMVNGVEMRRVFFKKSFKSLFRNSMY